MNESKTSYVFMSCDLRFISWRYSSIRLINLCYLKFRNTCCKLYGSVVLRNHLGKHDIGYNGDEESKCSRTIAL